jgi:hypothetical protein
MWSESSIDEPVPNVCINERQARQLAAHYILPAALSLALGSIALCKVRAKRPAQKNTDESKHSDRRYLFALYF